MRELRPRFTILSLRRACPMRARSSVILPVIVSGALLASRRKASRPKPCQTCQKPSSYDRHMYPHHLTGTYILLLI